ncbi:MAG: hypothetical protein HFJ20_04435 [Clostridia bacterium]|nr:hypothetical protein [Clostridia bacterium]
MFINKTSYIENCETSTVGQALGMEGYGIDTNIKKLIYSCRYNLLK